MPDTTAPADPGVSAGQPAEQSVPTPAMPPTANAVADVVRPDQPTQPDDSAELLKRLGIDDTTATQLPEEPQPAANITPEYLAALSQRSQYIRSEADVERATVAADNIWRTISGELSINDLFEAIRSENPEAYQRIMSDAVEYVSQITGQPIAEGAAGEAESPESQRIARIEAMLNEQRATQENAAFAQRVNSVKEQHFLPAVQKAIEGTFLSQDQPFVIQQLGIKYQGRELELIAQLERGDTTSLNRTIQGLQKEWRDRFNTWAKQIISSRNALSNSLPKTGGDGTSRRGERAAKGEFDLSTREGRLAYAMAQAPGKQQ